MNYAEVLRMSRAFINLASTQKETLDYILPASESTTSEERWEGDVYDDVLQEVFLSRKRRLFVIA